MTCYAAFGYEGHESRGYGVVSLRLVPGVATAEVLPEIVELLTRVFPRERPWGPDLEWQYLKNPCGAARYINAYDESGTLIAHYALLPAPPLAEPPVAVASTYLSLNVAADPAARVPGLMVATTRALFRHIEAEGPALLLGVTNEKSYQGFVRMLKFGSLGRLLLTLHPPGVLPRTQIPRALSTDLRQLGWRTQRPGVRAFADAGRGALTARLRYLGMPLDAVLSIGLEPQLVRQLGLPGVAFYTPRLYAGFGGPVRHGIRVPDRARPSPLEYVFRFLGDPDHTQTMARHLANRRFEFFDFDVV
jgi:hypothetical protein